MTSAATTSASSATVGSTAASSGSGGPPVDALYAAAVEADNPLAYFRFRETTTATPAHDEIGSLEGIYEGTFTLGAESPFGMSADTAASFGGGDVRLDHAELVLPTGPHSLEAWIKPTTIDMADRAIFSIEWPTATMGEQGYRMYVTKTGPNHVLTYRRAKDSASESISVPFPFDGNFHHVVATYDGAMTLCLLVDAVVTCKTGSPPTFDGTTTSAMIGKAVVSGELFLGLIDEAAFYDHALTAARVQAHYAAGQ